MKKVILLLIFISILFTTNLFAQKYYGISNSNYAGINGLYINPANIADNRMKADLQFFSGNFAVNQNYGYISSFKSFTDAVQFGKDLQFEKSNNKTNLKFNVLGELRGPSIMFQLDKKQAFGVLTRGRLVGNGNGINTEYFNLINDGIKSLKLPNGTTFTSGNVNISENAFTEIGLAYGREIINDQDKFLKAGIVLKRYNGLGFYSTRANNFKFTLVDTSISKVTYDGDINVAYSQNIDNLSSQNLLFGGPGSGLGIDIGVVYEKREPMEDDESDEPKYSSNRWENKYKYKIGFTIQDIGSMRYAGSTNNGNYIVKTNGPKTVSNADTAKISFSDLSSYFKSIPGATSTYDNNTLKIKAPTTITIYGDYKFKKHLYLNALFTGGLVGNNGNGTRTAFQAIVTPRYESKLFDAGLPISYNGLSKNVKVGLGLRLAVFYFGSDDLVSTAAGISKFTSANFYFGLHAALPYKKPRQPKEPKEKETLVIQASQKPEKKESEKKPEPTAVIVDTDGDGVPDNMDECPTVKGLAAFKGCPDTDGDGVPDKDDKCPDKIGSVENNGCPIINDTVIKQLNFAAQAIQFETGKDIIRNTSFVQLDNVVKILNDNVENNLVIDGHTDNVGSAEANVVLSKKRADAVKNYFVKKGINADRLITNGYGDTKPVAENNNALNKAKNRRVELSIK